MPGVVAWEVTNECNLVCRHCKANACSIAREQQSGGRSQPRWELTTAEALAFIDDISTFHPLLIFTGGEPLLRPDIEALIEHAAGLNMRTALATNGLLIDEARAQRLQKLGLGTVSVSIDSADAATHDFMRGVEGAYDSALQAVKTVTQVGLSAQINTTITNGNARTLPAIRNMVRASGADGWHIFFLVPTGRGKITDLVSPHSYYAALAWIEELEGTQDGLSIRPTCAPQHRLREGRRGCLAGVSYAFVSSEGIVQPCGYLPLEAGNIRRQEFAEIWRSSEILRALRTPFEWNNACNACTYGTTCRGCRARAFAISGDYLGDDPYCGGTGTCFS